MRSHRSDLHLHSNLSDGRHGPREVLRQCALSGLHSIALTDHDIAPSLPSGMHRVGPHTIRLVHGAEVTTLYEGTQLHLLVYFAGEMPPKFRAFLAERTQARLARYAEAAARLGLPGPDEAALAGARALGRLHLALALVDAGRAGSVRGAFEQLLGDVEPAAVPIAPVLSLASELGGTTSWAHPDPEQASRWAAPLARLGLHALEVVRPRMGRLARDRMMALAFKHKLAATGGSDIHGWQREPLGHFAIGERDSETFWQLLLRDDRGTASSFAPPDHAG